VNTLLCIIPTRKLINNVCISLHIQLIVLAPMYKLTPQYLSSYDQDKFNQTISPHHVLPYNSGEIINRVSVSCPLYDYVPPDLVSTYATNM